MCLFSAGILKQGTLLNQEFDAQRMAKQLRNCKSEEEVFACAARLYSAESFLYKLINTSQRNKDLSKVDTLGPICWLLYWHLLKNKNTREQLLYRGMNLTDEMIDEYKQAVGNEIRWPSFTSTSKNRQAAEQFEGNVLVIITIQHVYQTLCDISSLSHYPHEQEVLLQPQYRFIVDKIERDPKSRKYLIYIHGLH
jgi:hypothetical protein